MEKRYENHEKAICMFNSSSREGAHQIGLNRDALRQNIQFLTQYATQGIKLAGVGLSYGMTMLQTFQASSTIQDDNQSKSN